MEKMKKMKKNILYKGTSQEIRLELIEEEIEEKNNEINDIRKKILDSENKNEKILEEYERQYSHLLFQINYLKDERHIMLISQYEDNFSLYRKNLNELEAIKLQQKNKTNNNCQCKKDNTTTDVDAKTSICSECIKELNEEKSKMKFLDDMIHIGGRLRQEIDKIEKGELLNESLRRMIS